MKYFLIVLTVLVFTSARAQTAEDSVKAVISNLFTAMKNADGAMLKNCFSDSAVLQTIAKNRAGAMVVMTTPVQNFADQISKSVPGALDERISFETVKIDGPLAIAWTPYVFHYNGMISHCGTNSFQLVRFDGLWKIQYIIDTRRRDGCSDQ